VAGLEIPRFSHGIVRVKYVQYNYYYNYLKGCKIININAS